MPHLIRQVGGQEVAPETEEAADAQGAEKVADEVAEGRAPGPGRPEQQAADHRDDVGGPQFGEPRDQGNALEGDEDGGEEPGGEHRQHHHGGVIPHAPDFPHLAPLLPVLILAETGRPARAIQDSRALQNEMAGGRGPDRDLRPRGFSSKLG